MESISNYLSKKVNFGFGIWFNYATVSMGTSGLSPHHSALLGLTSVVLCFVHISTSLVQREFQIKVSINTFNVKSCILSLALESLPIVRKNRALDHNLLVKSVR